MKHLRVLVLTLTAIFATSALAASAAQAAAPEFKPNGGKFPVAFTSTGGEATLSVPIFFTVQCKKAKDAGEITGAKTVGGLTITFEECTAEKESKKCAVNSVNEPKGSGLVKTTILNGELGTVEKSQATSEVGLLVEAEAEGTFVHFEESECVLGAAIAGSIAAEVTPIKELKNHINLNFAQEAGKKKIKTITTTEAKKPSLNAFGVAGFLANSSEETFAGGELVEVS
jgi:hypothetical protein